MREGGLCGCWGEKRRRGVQAGQWSVLAGQGVLGGQLELCHFDGRAADGRCALIESQPKALGKQWIAQEC